MKKRSILIYSFLCSHLFLFSQQVESTKNLNDSVISLSEVVVSEIHKQTKISKLSVPLSYLPMTISTVSTRDLKMRGIYDLSSATQFIPSISAYTTYGGFLQFASRGFDHTPVMIDGVRDERSSINNSFPFPDIASVQSIELLKGPTSVLYGPSTIGGVLNVVRKRAVSERLLEARIAYGSWNYKQATIDAGGKITNFLKSRFVINWSDQEGYRHTKDKNFSIYGNLEAAIDSKQDLILQLGGVSNKNATDAGLPPFLKEDLVDKNGRVIARKHSQREDLDPRWRYNNDDDFLKNQNFNAMLTYTNRFSELFNLENKLTFMYDDIDYLSTEVINYVDSSAFSRVKFNENFGFAYLVKTITNKTSLSGDYKFGDIKNHYSLEYDYTNFSRNYNKVDVKGDGVDKIISVYNPKKGGRGTHQYFKSVESMSNTRHALGFQNLTEIGSAFKVLISGRYDFFKSSYRSPITLDGKRSYDVHAGGDKSSAINRHFSYRIGTVYSPSKELSVYGSLSNFFAPFVSQRSSTMIYIDKGGNAITNVSRSGIFDPITGYQVDFGLRYVYNDFLQLTTSIYRINKNNEVQRLDKKPELIGADGIRHADVQIGKTVSKGFEMDIIITPSSNSRFSVGYAYTNAYVKELPDVSKIEALTDFNRSNVSVGNQLVRIPKHAFTTSGNYQFKNRINLFYDINARSEISQTLDRSFVFPDYMVMNVGLNIPISKCMLGLKCNNLLNEKYFSSALDTQVMPSATRNYIVSLTYSL